MTAGSSANSSHALVPVATARSVARGADSPTSSTVTLISDTGLHSSGVGRRAGRRGRVRESYPRQGGPRAVVSGRPARGRLLQVPALQPCAPPDAHHSRRRDGTMGPGRSRPVRGGSPGQGTHAHRPRHAGGCRGRLRVPGRVRVAAMVGVATWRAWAGGGAGGRAAGAGRGPVGGLGGGYLG